MSIGRRRFVAALGGLPLYAQTERAVELANTHLALGIDRASGAIRSVENRAVRRRVDLPDQSCSVRVWAGTREQPDLIQIGISRNRPRTVHVEIGTAGDFQELRIESRDVDHSGITIRQTFRLAKDESFVRANVAIENRGPHWVTGLFAGLEGLTLSQDASVERLLSGDVSGKPIANPRHNLPAGSAFVPYPAGKRTFSIPPTVPTSLLVNWMDFSAPGLGIGTGYLNSQEMDMVAEVRGDPEALSLGWRFFRLEGTRGFMWGTSGSQQIYPLAPGEQFTSDEWLIVLHDGDWHNTAAAYRKRYEEAFRGDFLDWQTVSPTVRESDLIINGFIAWGKSSTDKTRAYDFPNGIVITRFDDVPHLVADVVQKLGVSPANTIVNLLGTGTHWGIYKMPDHFPMVEAAGGQAAGLKMAADLRQMGIAGLCFYVHPYFHHKDAANYEPAADTGLNYPHMDWHTSMGGIACMGESKWQDLWRKRIIPQFTAAGVTGLYVDEGFGHQFICTRAAHSHGGSALAILTAQSRGATTLYREFRKQAGERGFLECETAGDLQARWVDLWDFHPSAQLRFTHPDHMMMTRINQGAPTESVAQALIYGCPLVVRTLPAPFGRREVMEGELLDAVRRFVAIRREMREKHAPGYPWGFRDTIGLEVPESKLQAKLFTDGKAITLVYYTSEDFQGSINIRGEKIGVPGVKRTIRTLSVKAKQMGYLVIT